LQQLNNQNKTLVQKITDTKKKEWKSNQTYQCKNSNPWASDKVNNCHLKKEFLSPKRKIDSTYDVVEYYYMLDDLVWFDKVHNEAFDKLNHNVYHRLVDKNKDCLYKVLLTKKFFKL